MNFTCGLWRTGKYLVSQCSADKDTDLLQCETVAEDAVSGHYGDVSGLLGGDGAEQDIYLLGVKSAEQEFTGKVIAVYHRYDDNETKWIVVPCDDEGIVLEDVEIPTDNEIYAQIAFQEQFFCGVLVK